MNACKRNPQTTVRPARKCRCVFQPDALLFNMNNAAKLLGISRQTLWREVRRGRIRRTRLKMISRTEIDAYLARETKAAK